MNIRKAVLWVLAVVLLSTATQARTSDKKSEKATSTTSTKADAKIEWVSVEQLPELQKKQKRKVMVDVYTDWCGWCKVMDRKTFSDACVIEYVNKNFYAVKFNAEGDKNIIFYDKVYKFNSGIGMHDLAAKWLGPRAGFPTIAYLNEKGELIKAVPGYKDPAQLKEALAAILGK